MAGLHRVLLPGHAQGLEKYLMTKIYSKTFAGSDLDRERDQALYLRMKALNFVRPEHLDLPETDMEQEVLDRAKGQLNKINSYKVSHCLRHTL